VCVSASAVGRQEIRTARCGARLKIAETHAGKRGKRKDEKILMHSCLGARGERKEEQRKKKKKTYQLAVKTIRKKKGGSDRPRILFSLMHPIDPEEKKGEVSCAILVWLLRGRKKGVILYEHHHPPRDKRRKERKEAG